MSSTVPLYDITVLVYIRQLKCFHAFIQKAQQWCQDEGHPETKLTEGKLAEDMQPLHFQVQCATCMIWSGVFGPKWRFYTVMEEADHERDFAGMLDRLQKTIDWLQTFKRGDEGDAESQKYSYWTTGKEGEGDVITFGSASTVVQQFVLPNFYFHMTTAYDICRNQGAPLNKADFLLSAGSFT